MRDLMAATIVLVGLGYSAMSLAPNFTAADESLQKQNTDAVKYIDPGQFMIPELRKQVKVPRNEITIIDLTQLLREEFGIQTFLDLNALKDESLTGQEKLNIPAGVPLCLALRRALERVKNVPLDWYVDDGVLVLTTVRAAGDQHFTRLFDVSGLLEVEEKKRLSGDCLISMIQNELEGPWFDIDGEGGTLLVVKNILAVRHCQRALREVGALIKGLEQPARMTYLTDSPENEAVRFALQRPCSVAYDKISLIEMSADFSNRLKIPVELDFPALKDEGLTGQEEITLILDGNSAQTTLRYLLKNIGGIELAAIPDQGALRITSPGVASEYFSTIIFDISDLLTVVNGSDLAMLIQNETRGPWFDVDGAGGTLDLANGGRLVIRQTDAVLQEVTELINRSRELVTFGHSFPSKDPNLVETRYYRESDHNAEEFLTVIPRQIAPETWKSMGNPDGIGTIEKINIGPTTHIMIMAGSGIMGITNEGIQNKKKAGESNASPTSTLIIRQTVAVHEKIQGFLNEVKYGHREGFPWSGPGGCLEKFGIDAGEGFPSKVVPTESSAVK